MHEAQASMCRRSYYMRGRKKRSIITMIIEATSLSLGFPETAPASVRGWQQCVVRGRPVGLRSRMTSVLGWQQCAVRGRAFGLRAAFAQG